MRNKRRRFIPLWKKQCGVVNYETVKNNVEILKRAEKKTKINWVEKVYKGGRC